MNFLFPELQQDHALTTPPFYSVSVMASSDEEVDGENWRQNEDWRAEWVGITKWEIRHALQVLRDMGYELHYAVFVERMGMTDEDHRLKFEHDRKFANTRKRDR